MKTFAIVFVTISACLMGCSRGPAAISVVNHSGITVSNVWVSGPHFSLSIGTMTPETEVKLLVHPEGDSRCWLSYDTGTNKIDSGGRDYFTIGWTHPVSVTIGTNLNFTTPDGVKHI